MPQSPLTLKSTVTRRPAAEPVDQLERQQQAEHHQAAENVATTEQEVPTATPEPAPVPKAKHDLHALQSAFLASNLNQPVVMYLINGIKLTGRPQKFDQFTVILESPDGVNSLTFKHAISTMAPLNRPHNEATCPQSRSHLDE